MNDLSNIRPQLPPSDISLAPKSVKTVEPVAAVSSAEKSEAITAEEPSVKTAIVNSKVEETPEEKAKNLETAVKNVNDFVQTVQRDLHFSVDEESDRMVVKVVEASSGDIIRQIPNESFLELARKMKEQGEVQLVKASS